jgi:hypothetical protein
MVFLVEWFNIEGKSIGGGRRKSQSGAAACTLSGKLAHQNVLTMHYRGLVWQIPFFWPIYTPNV